MKEEVHLLWSSILV